MPLVKSLVGHRTVVVKLENRTFVVYFNSTDDAVRIVERKMYNHPPQVGYCNAMYWSAPRPLGKKNTLPKRIIELARNAVAP